MLASSVPDASRTNRRHIKQTRMKGSLYAAGDIERFSFWNLVGMGEAAHNVDSNIDETALNGELDSDCTKDLNVNDHQIRVTYEDEEGEEIEQYRRLR